MRFLQLSAGLLMAAPAARAAEAVAPASGTGVVLASVALLLAIGAGALAWYARRCAAAAAEEAGHARARAAQGSGGGGSTEAIEKAERLWATRFAALESQVLAPGTRAASRAPTSPTSGSADLAARVEELEKDVSGLKIRIKELQKAPPPTRERAPEAAPGDGIAWPALLAGDDSGIRDVRQALAPAVAAGDKTAQDLLEKLRQAERWPTAKPGASELATALQEISTQLLAVLRRDGVRGPLDAAMFADRVLTTLRPSWKPFQPQLDCRSMLPGATLDPDWMEDRTPAGLRRPVVSEMLSWAVFEKSDKTRRVLVKAKVSTE
ncbi:MAG: hypothetical protein FJ399_06650 [Verrucomicrobia bacterium]|nr:hypothetical protein [Verrucomicrobiota bacterium]